jgi:hypothetical protein
VLPAGIRTGQKNIKNHPAISGRLKTATPAGGGPVSVLKNGGLNISLARKAEDGYDTFDDELDDCETTISALLWRREFGLLGDIPGERSP